MTTVFSVSPLHQVHDINVTTDRGRRFVIEIILSSSPATFDATVTAHDLLSQNPGSWLYPVPETAQSASRIFAASMNLIQRYLAAHDPGDFIREVLNPCNDPFVSIVAQNSILMDLGLAPLAIN